MGLGTTELIIIFGIVLLVFGAGKLPKLAKDLGSGIKEFKKSMSGSSEDDDTLNTLKKGKEVYNNLSTKVSGKNMVKQGIEKIVKDI